MTSAQTFRKLATDAKDEAISNQLKTIESQLANDATSKNPKFQITIFDTTLLPEVVLILQEHGYIVGEVRTAGRQGETEQTIKY